MGKTEDYSREWLSDRYNSTNFLIDKFRFYYLNWVESEPFDLAIEMKIFSICLLVKKIMPSGRVHDRITLWIFPWIVIITYLVTRNGEVTLLTGAGFFFSGLMFGPDLDIHSAQYKRWGFLRWIWLPYRKLFRHRSLFSHGLIIGTVIRVIYLFLIIFAIAIFLVAIAQLLFGFAWNWQKFTLNSLDLLSNKYAAETIALWLGLELGAMSHSLSDWMISALKKQRTVSKKVRSKR